jgi:hypothetical protein
MQTSNIRYQFNLHWRKISLLGVCLVTVFSSYSQNNPTDNLINYDDQWIHYGFLIGIHSSKYVINYSDEFTSPALDTLHSVVPGNLSGFKVGFIANMNISRFLDFRGSS